MLCSPMYPVDEGIKIDNQDFDRHGDESEWEAYARVIARKIRTRVEEGIDREAVKHFSVFAIGPMPLLMFFGQMYRGYDSNKIYTKVTGTLKIRIGLGLGRKKNERHKPATS